MTKQTEDELDLQAKMFHEKWINEPMNKQTDVVEEFDAWANQIIKRPKSVDDYVAEIKKLGEFTDRLRDELIATRQELGYAQATLKCIANRETDDGANTLKAIAANALPPQGD